MEKEKVKSYLKVDYTEDDEYITELIAISDIYIQSCVGDGYKTNDSAIKLANILQLKLIKDMYDNRGTEIPSNSKKDIIVTTILDKLSNYSGVE